MWYGVEKWAAVRAVLFMAKQGSRSFFNWIWLLQISIQLTWLAFRKPQTWSEPQTNRCKYLLHVAKFNLVHGMEVPKEDCGRSKGGQFGMEYFYQGSPANILQNSLFCKQCVAWQLVVVVIECISFDCAHVHRYLLITIKYIKNMVWLRCKPRKLQKLWTPKRGPY